MSVLEKLSSVLKPQREGVQLIRDRKKIWDELTLAHKHGTVIGVIAPAMGEGMFLVGVESLHHEEQYVDFCPYDLSGRLLTWSSVDLSEIKFVCPFTSRYRHPLLFKTDFIK